VHVSPVMEYLQGRGVPFLVLPDPAATTADETAARHGFPRDEVIRTVVITTRYGHALLVVGSGRDIDEALVVAALGDTEVRMAGERDLLRNYPEYEPGSLPPLGLFFQAPVYVDTDVARRDAVIFAAGRAGVAIRMLTKDLFRDDPVVIAPLTTESAEEERRREVGLTVEEAGVAVTELPQDERAE
jgi:Ala-tRNA(Pro) deacylase